MITPYNLYNIVGFEEYFVTSVLNQPEIEINGAVWSCIRGLHNPIAAYYRLAFDKFNPSFMVRYSTSFKDLPLPNDSIFYNHNSKAYYSDGLAEDFLLDFKDSLVKRLKVSTGGNVLEVSSYKVLNYPLDFL